jgi:hypothetical protein
MATGGSSRGGGPTGQETPLIVQVTYGDVSLNLTFRPAAHTLTIGNDAVPLGPDDNVVLVDEVDVRGGPKVLKTLHIEPTVAPVGPTPMPTTTTLAFIRKSPELVQYLRCDVAYQNPNGAVQQAMRMICGRLQ